MLQLILRSGDQVASALQRGAYKQQKNEEITWMKYAYTQLSTRPKVGPLVPEIRNSRATNLIEKKPTRLSINNYIRPHFWWFWFLFLYVGCGADSWDSHDLNAVKTNLCHVFVIFERPTRVEICIELAARYQPPATIPICHVFQLTHSWQLVMFFGRISITRRQHLGVGMLPAMHGWEGQKVYLFVCPFVTLSISTLSSIYQQSNSTMSGNEIRNQKRQTVNVVQNNSLMHSRYQVDTSVYSSQSSKCFSRSGMMSCL